jgi:glycosyltransferase involved in cell wall biosynthesis
VKVAIIAPGGFDRSGRERIIPALVWLVERLARRHEVHVFVVGATEEPCRYTLVGAHIHDIGRVAGPPGVRLARRWRRLLGSLAQPGQWDVVHAFWTVPCGLLAGLAGRRFGAPAVVSIGGGELVWLEDIGYGGAGSWRGRVGTALALKLADGVTGGSRYVLTPLPDRMPGQVVPLGVDTASFAAPVARPAGPPWRIVHVGSINRVKDQVTLLRSLRLIADQEPRVHLDWVGEDTLQGAMQRLCAELGLSRHVAFHGFLPSDRVAPLFQAAHLNMLSSRHESQGVVVGEAGAAGVPTVGTRVGVVADLSPEAALAVPVSDPAALAEGVVALLRDPERR